MSRSVTALYLADLLDKSPDRLATFPVPPNITEERHSALLRDLLDAVGVLQESRSLRLAMFDGPHEDYPGAARIYVVHENPKGVAA